MASIAAHSISLLTVLLCIPLLFGEFVAYQIGLFLIYGIVAQGIGFLWGKTGILPLGQTMFFGTAAYASGHILTHVDGLFSQISLLLIVVAVIATIGFSLALVVFKGRSDSGPFFSLITLALVMIFEQIAGTATELTGGFNGLSGFTTIAGLDQFGSLYYLITIAAVLSTITLLWIDRLPAGLVARAIADNEARLQLFGFPTHVVKGAIFALSAALAAIAGILFANHQGIVTPTSTGFLLSANLVIWTAVGGRYHVIGPLLGAVVIGYLSSELRDRFIYWEVLLALGFIVVVLKTPGGITQFISNIFNKLFPRIPHFKTIKNDVPDTYIENDHIQLSFSEMLVKIGPVLILDRVELITPKQGIVCVIGPNGAGKTSLLNVITGGLMLSGGSVSLGNTRIYNRPPYKALKSGIARKLQVPSVFFSMSVQENLTLAMLAGRARFFDFFKTSSLSWRSSELETILNTPSLPLLEKLSTPVSQLAQGHRQFLEFVMTTAAQPRVLLLDEPCAGLSPEETRLMTKLVRQYQDNNNALIILIEHDMNIVRSLADHVVVLHQGSVLAQGSYAEVSADRAVMDVYAGGSK